MSVLQFRSMSVRYVGHDNVAMEPSVEVLCAALLARARCGMTRFTRGHGKDERQDPESFLPVVRI